SVDAVVGRGVEDIGIGPEYGQRLFDADATAEPDFVQARYQGQFLAEGRPAEDGLAVGGSGFRAVADEDAAGVPGVGLDGERAGAVLLSTVRSSRHSSNSCVLGRHRERVRMVGTSWSEVVCVARERVWAGRADRVPGRRRGR